MPEPEAAGIINRVRLIRRQAAPALPARLEQAGHCVHLRASRRARRLILRVHEDGFAELVHPPRTSLAQIQLFLTLQAAWLQGKLARAAERVPTAFPPAEVTLPALGENWRLHCEPTPGRLRLDSPEFESLRFRGRWDNDRAHLLLRRWLAGRALEVLSGWLDEVAAEQGLAHAGLQVRLQRTRWGSCSSRGRISLNAAILFHRPDVLRYLLVHELAHTRHLDHSADFWRLVERCEPRWRELDAQLRHGWSPVPAWARPGRQPPTGDRA
ncbi:MAG: hypothetical protein RL026_2248 [Pseudomonadota bacterium]|jgi:predicted metal-dependent hydrolase